MNKKISSVFILVLAFVFCPVSSFATAPDFVLSEVASLRNEWATIKYRLHDVQQKKDRLAPLETRAAQVTSTYPAYAEPKIMQAIILATDVELTKNMASLPKVNQVKSLLEQAISIDPRAMDGTAHVVLGTLYYQLPGWPISFGNNKKAGQHFSAALAIDPHGMDTNYFYGQYLLYRDRPDEAIQAFERALAAKPRPEFAYIENPRRLEMLSIIARLKERAVR